MKLSKVSLVLAAGALAAASMTGTAAARPASGAVPANCTLHSYGEESVAGSQARWTEYFSNNCADVRVRAVVVCEDIADGAHHTKYGKTINGNGYSYYTCNIFQNVDTGHGQYYNGIKWINLST